MMLCGDQEKKNPPKASQNWEKAVCLEVTLARKKISSGLAAAVQIKMEILSLLRWDHLHSGLSLLMVLWSISTWFKEIILILFPPLVFSLCYIRLLSQFRDISRYVALFLEPAQCSLLIQQLITMVRCCQTIDIHYGDEAPYTERIFSRWAFRILKFQVNF